MNQLKCEKYKKRNTSIKISKNYKNYYIRILIESYIDITREKN